jgi:hypothetical protein
MSGRYASRLPSVIGRWSNAFAVAHCVATRSHKVQYDAIRVTDTLGTAANPPRMSYALFTTEQHNGGCMTATPHTWRRARGYLPLIGLLTALGVSACDDNNDDFVAIPVITDTVVTFHDASFNFQAIQTFSMPDTVVHFAPLTGTPLDVSRAFDQTILSRVRADFISRGYTEDTDPRNVRPDFVVLVGATATQNYNAFVSYPWYGSWGFYSGWGWYAPGFDTSWGIAYPWYPTVGITSYDRGTVVVTLIPTLSVNPLGRSVTAAWAGVATSLLNGTLTTTSVNNAIDEMFRQSPYLTAASQ